MDALEHAQELEELKKSDPEFYKFLLKEDQSLLSFGEEVPEGGAEPSDEGDDEDDEGDAAAALMAMDTDEDEGEEGEGKDAEEHDASDEAEATKPKQKKQKEKKSKQDKKEKKQKKGEGEKTSLSGAEADEASKTLTVALVNAWAKRLRARPLAMIRKLVIAFSSVVQPEDNKPQTKRKGQQQKPSDLPSYTVTTPSAYNALLHLTLSQVPMFIHKHLHVKDNKTRVPQLPGWKKIKTVVKVFTTAVLSLVKQATDKDMVTILVKTLSQLAPFITPLPKLRSPVLKTISTLCTREEASVTVAAVLFMRQLTYYGSPLFGVRILKSAYMTYVRCTKFVNMNNYEHVKLLRTAVKELFLQDMTGAYQLAFVYIRQLSVHVRDALALKRTAAMQAVHSWQFVACIQLWAELLSDAKQAADDSPMDTLVYPFIQVCLGAVNLSSSARHFPMHFHVLRAVMHVSTKARVCIPLVPHILAPLDSAEMTRKPIRRIAKPLNMELLLTFPKAYQGTKPFQDAVLQEVTGLMLQYLDSFACHIAFPELAIPVQAFCKSFMKKCKVNETRRAIKTLSEQIEANSSFILQHRSTVEHSPIEAQKNEKFEQLMQSKQTPMQKYVQLWRAHELKKQKLLKSHGTVPEDAEDDRVVATSGKATKRSGSAAAENEEDEFEDEDEWDFEEEDEEEQQQPAAKRSKRKQQKKKKQKKKGRVTKASLAAGDDEEGEATTTDKNLDWMYD